MNFECACGTMLSGQTAENGEIKRTIKCGNCGGVYVATISQIAPPEGGSRSEPSGIGVTSSFGSQHGKN